MFTFTAYREISKNILNDKILEVMKGHIDTIYKPMDAVGSVDKVIP